MIPYHRAGLSRSQRPYRKFPVAGVHIQHTPHHIVHESRVEEGLKRMPGPESIPKGQCGIIAPALRDSRNAAVVPPVLSVYVIHDIGSEHGMITGGVEIHEVAPFPALDHNISESFIPERSCGRPDCIEIQSGYFRQTVLPGIFRADGRKSHRHFHGRGFRSEGQKELPAPREDVGFSERCGKSRVEVYVLVCHPARGAAHT